MRITLNRCYVACSARIAQVFSWYQSAVNHLGDWGNYYDWCCMMLVFICGRVNVIDCISHHRRRVRIVMALWWLCFYFNTFSVCVCSFLSFGKQLGGRRGCECITLEPSEMIVVSRLSLLLSSICVCLSVFCIFPCPPSVTFIYLIECLSPSPTSVHIQSDNTGQYLWPWHVSFLPRHVLKYLFQFRDIVADFLYVSRLQKVTFLALSVTLVVSLSRGREGSDRMRQDKQCGLTQEQQVAPPLKRSLERLKQFDSNKCGPFTVTYAVLKHWGQRSSKPLCRLSVLIIRLSKARHHQFLHLLMIPYECMNARPCVIVNQGITQHKAAYAASFIVWVNK